MVVILEYWVTMGSLMGKVVAGTWLIGSCCGSRVLGILFSHELTGLAGVSTGPAVRK